MRESGGDELIEQYDEGLYSCRLLTDLQCGMIWKFVRQRFSTSDSLKSRITSQSSHSLSPRTVLRVHPSVRCIFKLLQPSSQVIYHFRSPGNDLIHPAPQVSRIQLPTSQQLTNICLDLQMSTLKRPEKG